MFSRLHNYYNYFYNYYFGNTVEQKNDDFIKVGYVSINDLKSVNLNPVKDIVPNPSRNAPPFFEKVDLRNLNKAQLDAILNVKLKPTPPIIKKIYFEPRHPVIRELHQKYKLYDA